VGIAAWTVTWIAHRLFSLHLPMGWIALGGLVVCTAISLIWLVCTRDETGSAAAALDEAAGLKERVATGLMVQGSTDPFAQAVKADAERVVTGLSARKLIPVRWSRSLSFSAVMIVVALLSLLVPQKDLLKRDEAKAAIAENQAAVNHVKLVVAKPVEAMKE